MMRLTLVALLCSLPAWPADYYVATTGGGSDCTIGSPCATINAAIAKVVTPGINGLCSGSAGMPYGEMPCWEDKHCAKFDIPQGVCGCVGGTGAMCDGGTGRDPARDVIHVADGTYGEFDIGTAKAGVVIVADNPLDVVVNVSGSDRVYIQSSGVTIDGLSINGGTTHRTLEANGDCDFLTLRNNRLHAPKKPAPPAGQNLLHISGCDDVQIHDNHIFLGSVAQVTNRTAEDMSYLCPSGWPGGGGIVFQLGADLLFEDNLTEFTGGLALGLTSMVNPTIRRNTFNTWSAHGIQMGSRQFDGNVTRGALIENNVFKYDPACLTQGPGGGHCTTDICGVCDCSGGACGTLAECTQGTRVVDNYGCVGSTNRTGHEGRRCIARNNTVVGYDAAFFSGIFHNYGQLAQCCEEGDTNPPSPASCVGKVPVGGGTLACDADLILANNLVYKINSLDPANYAFVMLFQTFDGRSNYNSLNIDGNRYAGTESALDHGWRTASNDNPSVVTNYSLATYGTGAAALAAWKADAVGNLPNNPGAEESYDGAPVDAEYFTDYMGGDFTPPANATHNDAGVNTGSGTINAYCATEDFDGTIRTGTCDPGAYFVSATPGVCGDGTVDAGEDCDVGEFVENDCCTDECAFVADTTACDDLLFCTTGTTCNATGTCGGGFATDCAETPSDVVCTLDTCDEDTDSCVHTVCTTLDETCSDTAILHDASTVSARLEPADEGPYTDSYAHTEIGDGEGDITDGMAVVFVTGVSIAAQPTSDCHVVSVTYDGSTMTQRDGVTVTDSSGLTEWTASYTHIIGDRAAKEAPIVITWNGPCGAGLSAATTLMHANPAVVGAWSASDSGPATSLATTPTGLEAGQMIVSAFHSSSASDVASPLTCDLVERADAHIAGTGSFDVGTMEVDEAGESVAWQLSAARVRLTSLAVAFAPAAEPPAGVSTGLSIQGGAGNINH